MSLTTRDTRLIELVAEREALTRVQISRALQFGSVTRVNSVLLRLTRHAYLVRRFQPTLAGTRRAVYVIGPRGFELLGAAPGSGVRFKLSSDLFLSHRLAVNDVWLAFVRLDHPSYQFLGWRDEASLRPLSLGCVPDAYVEYMLRGQTFSAFVEADLGTEAPKRWTAKARAYAQMAFSGLYERTLSRRYFRVLVVTTSEHRTAAIARTIAPTTDRIFWITTSAALQTSGPFGQIWRRPKHAALQSLTS